MAVTRRLSDLQTGVVGRFGTWIACEHPERRPDDLTTFERHCRGCAVALQAAVNAQPPPGAFDGWWRTREESAPLVQAFLREAGISSTPTDQENA